MKASITSCQCRTTAFSDRTWKSAQPSAADATWAVDHSGADWEAQAVKKAKSYMESGGFSRGSLIDQLLYEKFTQAQAVYAADQVGL